MSNGKKRTKSVGGKLKSPNVSSGAFYKLKALSCFSEVHTKLVDGWPLAEVARFIQNDRGEYTEITKDGLVGILHKYRQTIPAMEFSKVMPPAIAEKAKEIQEAMDELVEMEKLYKLQRERIDIDAKTEKTIKKLLPTMTQEIRVAKDILNDYAQLKMDLGINERNLGTQTVSVTGQVKYGNPHVEKVLENPQSRRKLLGIAQRLVTGIGMLKDGDSLLPLMEEDGEIVEAEPVAVAPKKLSPPPPSAKPVVDYAIPEDAEVDFDAILAAEVAALESEDKE